MWIAHRKQAGRHTFQSGRPQTCLWREDTYISHANPIIADRTASRKRQVDRKQPHISKWPPAEVPLWREDVSHANYRTARSRPQAATHIKVAARNFLTHDIVLPADLLSIASCLDGGGTCKRASLDGLWARLGGRDPSLFWQANDGSPQTRFHVIRHVKWPAKESKESLCRLILIGRRRHWAGCARGLSRHRPSDFLNNHRRVAQGAIDGGCWCGTATRTARARHAFASHSRRPRLLAVGWVAAGIALEDVIHRGGRAAQSSCMPRALHHATQFSGQTCQRPFQAQSCHARSGRLRRLARNCDKEVGRRAGASCCTSAGRSAFRRWRSCSSQLGCHSSIQGQRMRGRVYRQG